MTDRKKRGNAESRVIPWLPGYSVGEDGTIYSEKGAEPHEIVPRQTAFGLRVKLNVGGARNVYVATMVCEAWHGPRPKGHAVGYRDGDRNNCRAENVHWTMPGDGKSLNAEEFVRVWQDSQSIAEAAERMGISYAWAWKNSKAMRERGVPLKKMTGQSRRAINDDEWESLRKLAIELSAESGEAKE